MEQNSNKDAEPDTLEILIDHLKMHRDVLSHDSDRWIHAITELEDRISERIKTEIAAAEIRMTNAIVAEANMVRFKVSEHVSAEAGDLRQIGHLLSRQTNKTAQRIRCIFLVNAIESWDAQIDIYEAMLNDNRFDPIVVSINRIFPGDAAYGGEEITSSALDRAGVQHLRLGMEPSWPALDILRALGPDIIFRQSQWEDDYPPAFHTSRINFAKICSIPYGMSIVSKFAKDDEDVLGSISAKSFDQYYHRMAWRVFCETEQTRDYFSHFRHSDPKKFVVSGYPKLARLLKARDEPDNWPIKNGRRFRVIWAPHHSVGNDWLGFGTFDRFYREFLHLAAERLDVDFVLKPHPALFASLTKNGVISQTDLDNFIISWQELPNCALEIGNYAHLFAASDMMFTDGLSFFTEYSIFEKPLIFIESGHHVPMNALGDAALAAMQHVSTFDEIKIAIENYAAGAAWPLKIERQNLLEMLFPRERKAVDIIIDSIIEGLSLENQENL